MNKLNQFLTIVAIVLLQYVTKCSTTANSGLTVRVSTLWWQGDGRDKRQWKSPDLSAGLSLADYRNNVDPALKLALEYVPGKTLRELLSEALANNNPKRVIDVFNEWRAAPINKYARGEVQLTRLGYELLAKKQIDQAIEIFKLNVDAYPDQIVSIVWLTLT